jgi:hypothetical protein
MSNEVTKKSSHEIVDDGFEEFEDRVEGSEERTGSVVQRPIIGFTNEAEWVNKDSDEKLPADRELVAIKHFRVLQKWRDGLPVKMKNACSSRVKSGPTSGGLTTQCRAKNGLTARMVSRVGPGRRNTSSSCLIRGPWIASATRRAQSAAVCAFAISSNVSS